MKPFPLFHEDKPALFLAPLAGLTHSPFRRLLSDFGGYSALYSEMLSGKALESENVNISTYIRRRPEEGKVVYQLQLNNEDAIEDIIGHLTTKCDPFAIDINLGCPAPSARKRRTGARLFLEYDEVKSILERIKAIWDGPLSVKTRLGSRKMKGWEDHLYRMVDLFAEQEVSWHTLHPRFSEDALRRSPQRSFFPKLVEHSPIPLIGNGDILTADQLKLDTFTDLSGAMIGRTAVAKPWIFREISDPTFNADEIDMQEVWNRLFDYVTEEFRPERAIGRMKQFTSYFGQNFTYGHTLYSSMINTGSLDDIYSAANTFLEKKPTRVKHFNIMQL